MILGDFICSTNSFNIFTFVMVWLCVCRSFWIVFFLCFLLVMQLFSIFFFLFLTSSFVKDSSVMILSNFPDLLSLSSSSSVAEKTWKNSCWNLSWMFQYCSLVWKDILVPFWISHLHLIHFSGYKLIYLDILDFLLVTV